MGFVGHLNPSGIVELTANFPLALSAECRPGTIGITRTVKLRHLPAGTYYENKDSGELFDTEGSAEDSCYNYATDEHGEEIEDPDDPDFFEPYYDDSVSFETHRIEPWFVTRQRGFYREGAPSVNITQGWESVPPGCLEGTKAFPISEYDTLAEARAGATAMAARWAVLLGEPVIIERDNADIGGDVEMTALADGVTFVQGDATEGR